jgi:hypothetical protein
MPLVATASKAYYQWSTSGPPVVRMAGLDCAPTEAPPSHPAEGGERAEDPGRLTDRLNERLSELRAEGCAILWIEAALADLTTLLEEGGDEAIVLDPDPNRDVAWYGGCKIRHTALAGVRIYAQADSDGAIDCHPV